LLPERLADCVNRLLIPEQDELTARRNYTGITQTNSQVIPTS
jgi:hypothetical protein